MKLRRVITRISFRKQRRRESKGRIKGNSSCKELNINIDPIYQIDNKINNKNQKIPLRNKIKFIHKRSINNIKINNTKMSNRKKNNLQSNNVRNNKITSKSNKITDRNDHLLLINKPLQSCKKSSTNHPLINNNILTNKSNNNHLPLINNRNHKPQSLHSSPPLPQGSLNTDYLTTKKYHT